MPRGPESSGSTPPPDEEDPSVFGQAPAKGEGVLPDEIRVDRIDLKDAYGNADPDMINIAPLPPEEER
jgi:hypothetical protein